MKINKFYEWLRKHKTKEVSEAYICPQTKKQCRDECCVSAEDCHIQAGIGIIFDCEQESYGSKGSDDAEPKNYYYGTDEFGTYRKIYCKNKEQTLYTEDEVIEFTMKMISQYVFGNTNIWDRDRLKESLSLKQPKKD